MPAVKAGGTTGFRRFFNFLIKCNSLFAENKINTLINNSDVIRLLLSKFPTCLEDRWNRKVCKIGRSYEREGELVNLIEMVDQEVILVNDLEVKHQT